MEQIPDDPVLEMVEQLVKLPWTVSKDGIQQRTVERIAEIPVPQVVEELVEVFKVFPQDRIQQRLVEQTIETPDITLAEKIVEGPVTQTQGKTQQIVNRSVQHVLDTLEVEKHIIQEKINQVTRHVETPLLQFTDKVVDIPVVAQRQIRMNRKVEKIIEIPQLRQTDQMVDVPVVVVAQVPQVRVVQVPRVQVVVETAVLLPDVQVPQVRVLFGEKIAAIPEVRTVQGPQTSESFREILMRGVAPNTEADSFIDDLSSFGSKGLNHQDCEVLFHAGMKRNMKRIAQQPVGSQQQQQDNQPQTAMQSLDKREKERGERSRRKRVGKKG